MGEFLLPFYFLKEIKYFIVVFTNDYVLILFLVKTNSFFFNYYYYLWSRVLDRTMPLYKECLKKSTTWLPLNLSHSCPTLPQRIMGQQILMLKKKKSLEKTLKDKIHATNHSHAIFVTKELMSSCSSLHPRPFMDQAKNFSPLSRLQVAFWHYSFDGTLFMKTCRDWMCTYVWEMTMMECHIWITKRLA